MKDFADITFIVDRSGSMDHLTDDVVGGYAKFVKEQQALGDNACLTLVQFDNVYEVVFSAVPIKNVSPNLKFVARATTALLDALGRTIKATGERLANLPESERPDKVVVVIFTDGAENASTEFSNEQVKALVEEQQNKYNWKFLFLGANIDAFHTGAGLGIAAQTTTNFAASSVGMQGSLNAVSSYTSCLRSTGSVQSSMSALYNASVDANTVSQTGGTK